MVCRGHKRVPTRVFCRSTFDARHSLRHVVRTLLQAADLLNDIEGVVHFTPLSLLEETEQRCEGGETEPVECTGGQTQEVCWTHEHERWGIMHPPSA
mgnify:CR=1 FL=1